MNIESTRIESKEIKKIGGYNRFKFHILVYIHNTYKMKSGIDEEKLVLKIQIVLLL